MADKKISGLTELAETPASNDVIPMVDISDTTDAVTGTTKKVTRDNLIPDSSESVKGKVELATDAEVSTGTDTARAITPAGLEQKTAGLTTKGIVELATGAETNTGTDATRAVTPDGLDDWTGSAQITTLGTVGTGAWEGDVVSATYLPDASATAQGVSELAIAAEIDTGTDATRTMPVDQFVASKRNIRWLVFNLVEATTDCAIAANIHGDFVSPIAGTILQIDTAPFYLYATNSTAGINTGVGLVVDISIGGTTIMTSNKLDFDTTEKTTTTAGTPPDLTTTALAVGDIITIDIDSIHDGTAAKGLTVFMAIRE